MVRFGRPTTRQGNVGSRATRSPSMERIPHYAEGKDIPVSSYKHRPSGELFQLGDVFDNPDLVGTPQSVLAGSTMDQFYWRNPELTTKGKSGFDEQDQDFSDPKYCGAQDFNSDDSSSDSSDSTDGITRVYRPLYRPPERSSLATYQVPGSRKSLAHDRYQFSIALPDTHLEFWDIEKRYRNILIGLSLTIKATQACVFVSAPKEIFLHVYTERLGNRFLVPEAKHSFDQVYHRVVQPSSSAPHEFSEGKGEVKVMHNWQRERIGSLPLEALTMLIQVDVPWELFMKNETKKFRFEVQAAMSGHAFSDSAEMTICNLASETHGLQVRDGVKFLW